MTGRGDWTLQEGLGFQEAALQKDLGQLREHSPPARLDNRGVDTCLLEGHLRADFALLEFKLDLTDAGEVLWHFQAESEQMGFVDQQVISKMVDRAVPRFARRSKTGLPP